MSDQSNIPDKCISEALDIMVEAKWVEKYAEDPTGFAVKWTQKGESEIMALLAAFQNLGPQKLNPDLWWAIAAIASGLCGPGPTPPIFDS